jgi:2-polyprenyl-6-methoxyphenol hydroxylase-like FAD-dependent oxidoreductase
VTLIGDAAHPMLPFMGQGAAQSIEDGLALARCLAADRDDPRRAIGTYAARRRERATALQAASRDAGRDLQLSDAAEVAGRNAQMRKSPEAPLARYDWVWGYDVESALVE